MAERGGQREGAGRPISEATIKAQLAREYISEQVKLSLSAIVAKAVTQAIEGDKYAREWLSDRAWGKAPINLGVDDTGQPIPILGGITADLKDDGL